MSSDTHLVRMVIADYPARGQHTLIETKAMSEREATRIAAAAASRGIQAVVHRAR